MAAHGISFRASMPDNFLLRRGGTRQEGSLYERNQYFRRSAHRAISGPAEVLDTQAEATEHWAPTTKNVPILRIDHISIESSLLGVWRGQETRAISGGMPDFSPSAELPNRFGLCREGITPNSRKKACGFRRLNGFGSVANGTLEGLLRWRRAKTVDLKEMSLLVSFARGC